jgi:hypothetical protein
MTDSPRSGASPDPTSPYEPYQGYSDPAYAGSAPSVSGYSAVPSSGPGTQPLAPHWTQTTGYVPPVSLDDYSTGSPPPGGTHGWLWVAAGLVLVVVIGSVAWLLWPNPSTDTTAIPAQKSTTPSTAPTTTKPVVPTAIPSFPSFPIPSFTLPPIPGFPTTSNPSGETETVEYEVTGGGRALSILYIDTGGVMQLEYAVQLPWRKEAELAKPAKDSASVMVANAGNQVTCKIAIGGVQVQQKSGTVLITCGPFS